MKRFFFSALLAIVVHISFAQDINLIIKDAQILETKPDEKSAFLKYKEVLKIQPQNIIALTRCSEICSSIGNKEKSSITRDAYFKTAFIYAQTALKLYPESDIVNVAMAIAMGRIILTKSGKEKIVSVKELKNYADKAIKINPSNFKAWHILGKWNYEVSNLTSFERTAAKLLYGALPSASFENAVAYYEKAKALSPAFVLNYLELAKAYKKNGEKAKAIATLKAIQNLKNITEDDPRIKEESQGLLKNWEK